ncbi:MAG: BMP family ABC transporter substrate-binding protein [Nitrospinota bacterium]
MSHDWKRLAAAALTVLLAALVVVHGAHALEPQAKIKAAFIYNGPIGDHGWIFAHEKGRRELEKALPYVETAYTESVSAGDAERVMNQYLRRGYNVIFGCTFEYMDIMLKLAKRYPKAVFLHVAGFKVAPNMGTYWAKIYQPSYLAGIVAGKMTKTNVIGYAAAFPIPLVLRIFNAFVLGVQSVNPNAKVHLVWTLNWFDPAKEREAGESLVDIGADVLAQYFNSPAVQQAAQRRGKYSIGVYSDMSAFAPKAHLTAPVFNWGGFYKKVAEEVHKGTWKSTQYWGGMNEGVVSLAPLGPMVPQAVRDLVERKKAGILSGKLDVFHGPIKDQSGKVRVPAGKSMSEKDMLSMDFLVEGVVGKIPK